MRNMLDLFAVQVLACQTAIESFDAAFECCELALNGSPCEISRAQQRFLDTRLELFMLGYQTYLICTNHSAA